MTLILIRHGKTEANEKHLYCGSTDIGLSQTGINELEELKTDVTYPDISGMRVLTSGKKRCEETLGILFGEIPHEIDPRLSEMDFGAFEMRSYEEMKEDPEYIRWITGDNESNVAPGGESGVMMTDRVLDALNEITQYGKDSLVITHGGVIAAMMSFMFPEENKNRYEWQSAPGRGYIIDTSERSYDSI